MTTTCETCHKNFKTHKGYEKHVIRNNCMLLLVLCPHCPSRFGHKRNLYRHLKTSCKTVKNQKELEEIKLIKEQLNTMQQQHLLLQTQLLEKLKKNQKKKQI